MVRHAEEKHDFISPRTSTDENRLACGNSFLSVLIIFFINRCTTNSPFAAHLVIHLKTAFSTMYSWCFRPVQPEPGFNPPTTSFWQASIISQRMNASLIACSLFFSKTVLTNRGKEQPNGNQIALPFKHQRHGNCDYKSSCHDESYMTAGRLTVYFFVGFSASPASMYTEMDNRPGATFFIRGR